jgi:hypothetical protein
MPSASHSQAPSIERVILRRRRALPPELEPVASAFGACAAQVDLAQRAMLRCVPSSARSVALPLSVGAETVRLALADAAEAMPAWRHPALEDEWAACSRALEETLDGLDRAVATASATDELEDALTAVQDLLDPLHAFVDAEAAIRALRR